jgi:hypothetical protein
MPRGTITSKITRICTYADNVVIMARNKSNEINIKNPELESK